MSMFVLVSMFLYYTVFFKSRLNIHIRKAGLLLHPSVSPSVTSVSHVSVSIRVGVNSISILSNQEVHKKFWV